MTRTSVPRIFCTMLTLVAALTAPLVAAQIILAARVNGTAITQERLERFFEEDLRQRNLNILQIRNPERLKQLKRAVLNNLIEQELFWQAAQKTGTVATPEEVEQTYQATQALFKSAEAFEQRIRVEGYTPATYRRLVQQQVSARKYADRVAAKAPVITEEEVHRFYQDNPEQFHRPERLRVRHILIRVPEDTADAERTEKRRHIERILKDLRAGQDFAKLARLHSEAPTKQWGGEMEPFGRGQTAKSFEDAVFALVPGQISDVIATPGGLQIVKLEDRSEAITISEAQARASIRNYLQAYRAKETIDKEIERLRAAGKVEIVLPL